MNAVRGTFAEGKIVLTTPPDWAEGTEVEVRPVDPIGIPEEEQGDDPESIAKWLAWYDTVQPLILTKEDEERIAAARKAEREYELSTRKGRSEQLRKMWE